jgi:hypothetical protein
MRVCPPCQVYLDQMRQTIELLGHLPEDTISPETERVLLVALRNWPGQSDPGITRVSRLTSRPRSPG